MTKSAEATGTKATGQWNQSVKLRLHFYAQCHMTARVTVDRTLPPRQLCSVAASIPARILDACDLRRMFLGIRASCVVGCREKEGRGEGKRSGSRVSESDRGTSIASCGAHAAVAHA